MTLDNTTVSVSLPKLITTIYDSCSTKDLQKIEGQNIIFWKWILQLTKVCKFKYLFKMYIDLVILNVRRFPFFNVEVFRSWDIFL